ncbi:MAG: PH domain-containing protein [Patescibacteria group bacterium]|nr:PH domain-containing protein [Patescibacteria group bacterium]
MPPTENNQIPPADPAPTPSSPPKTPPNVPLDKNGYRRLGHSTLYFLLIKYGFPAIILFLIELVLLGAAAGGNVLPPFSEWVSSSLIVGSIVRFAAGTVPALILISLLVAAIMAYGWYWSFRYRLGDNDLSFEKGLISIQEISVPFRQIQNVDIEQSVLYRIFDLADLVILTAGHEDPEHLGKSESEIIMPALNEDEARGLQEYLLDRANVVHAVSVAASSEPPVPPPLN